MVVGRRERESRGKGGKIREIVRKRKTYKRRGRGEKDCW
jgi:hypothetical protein